MPDEQPTVGRIVHFYEKQNVPQAAIITQVLYEPHGTVNLCVFESYGASSGRMSINKRKEPSQTHVWDWPERT